jgi:hypothetical protein
MPQEQVLPKFDFAHGQANGAAIAQQKAIPELPTDPIADVVAEDGTRCGCRHHTADVLIMATYVESRQHERAFAR